MRRRQRQQRVPDALPVRPVNSTVFGTKSAQYLFTFIVDNLLFILPLCLSQQEYPLAVRPCVPYFMFRSPSSHIFGPLSLPFTNLFSKVLHSVCVCVSVSSPHCICLGGASRWRHQQRVMQRRFHQCMDGDANSQTEIHFNPISFSPIFHAFLIALLRCAHVASQRCVQSVILCRHGVSVSQFCMVFGLNGEYWYAQAQPNIFSFESKLCAQEANGWNALFGPCSCPPYAHIFNRRQTSDDIVLCAICRLRFHKNCCILIMLSPVR